MTCGSSGYQAARAYSLMRPPRTGFRRIRSRSRSATFGGHRCVRVRDALGDALVRPGCVVVHPVFSQDGAQMAFPRDQNAVQDLTAQGADEPLADRVHPRSLDGRAHDPGAGGLEDGAERGGEVRSAVMDEEPDVLEPLAEGEGQVAGLLHGPLSGRVRCDAAQVHPAGSVLDEHQGRTGAAAGRCPRAGSRPRGSRQPGHAGTAATSGRNGEAPDRCPRHAGSPTQWTARWSRRASPTRRGSAGVPTADSPSPAGQRGGRCPGLSAGVQACTACSCRTCPPPACGAMPEASRASRERPRPSACAGQAAPARQATPGQPARTAPGRRAAAVRRSHAGAPAAPHLWPSHPGRNYTITADTCAARPGMPVMPLAGMDHAHWHGRCPLAVSVPVVHGRGGALSPPLHWAGRWSRSC